jgi:hypothetical protein
LKPNRRRSQKKTPKRKRETRKKKEKTQKNLQKNRKTERKRAIRSSLAIQSDMTSPSTTKKIAD